MASGCVRVDSTQKKIQKIFPGASGLVFLSLTSGLVFLTFLSGQYNTQLLAIRVVRDTRSTKPVFFFVVLAKNTRVWRLEERPPL